MLACDSPLCLTHFKGHVLGGSGGSYKNIGTGCANGRIGKAMIHTRKGEGQRSIAAEAFMERMTETGKATVDHFAPHAAFVNFLRSMSVSCGCEGVHAQPDDAQHRHRGLARHPGLRPGLGGPREWPCPSRTARPSPNA
ncbi:MAG: DUF362 domain-containing protein, partial [Desulfovibrio sp.]|nr:DUF362 domain-containing protein [Desulfovibrio sp.]